MTELTPFSEEQIEHLCNMYNRVGQELMYSKIISILENRLGKMDGIVIDLRKEISEHLFKVSEQEFKEGQECKISETLFKRFEEFDKNQEIKN